MKKYLIFIIVMVLTFSLSACNLAEEPVDKEVEKEDLLIGTVFHFKNKDNETLDLDNNDYFKIYVSNYNKDGLPSTVIYGNKGIINPKVNSKEEVIDGKSYINNDIKGEIVINRNYIIWSQGVFIDNDGNLKYQDNVLPGVSMNEGMQSKICFDTGEVLFQDKYIRNKFEYTFTYVTEEVYTVSIREYDKDGNQIKYYVVPGDKDHDYKIRESCEYIIITESVVGNNIDKKVNTLINKTDITDKHYFLLKIFNHYGFIEGNQLIISK